MKSLIISIVLLATGAAFAAEERIDQQALNSFVQAQHQLQNQLSLMCNNKEANVNTPLKQSIIHWFKVQALQLPAAEFMQTDYVYVFWPDSKDRLKKQVLSAVSQSLDKNEWATLPASVKSLSAIEFLLQTENPKAYCNWLLAISDYQITQADQLKNLQAFYEFDETERLTALHGTALTLHMILKEVLSRPGKTLWVLGPGWRSKSGVDVVVALAAQNQALLATFDGKEKSVANWEASTQTFEPLSYEANRDTLEQWNTYGENLADYVENSLAPALNIFIGFNNFDGD